VTKLLPFPAPVPLGPLLMNPSMLSRPVMLDMAPMSPLKPAEMPSVDVPRDAICGGGAGPTILGSWVITSPRSIDPAKLDVCVMFSA
jgi:hypothetical protein